MKNKFLLLSLLTVTTLSGCVKYNGAPDGKPGGGGGDDPITVDESVKEITCDPMTITFNKGDEKKKVTPTVTGEGEFDDSVTIKSNDEAIATVSEAEGKSGNAFYVNPIGVGKTKIVVTSKVNSTVKCEVEVEVLDKDAVIPVTGLALNKTTLELIEGTSETLVATVEPSNATNKEITWSTNDSSIATVDGTGKVTALKAGEAVITATSKDGQKVASCTVTVKLDEIIVDGWYLVGSMTNWKPEKKYYINPTPDGENQLVFTWLGNVGDEVKVIYFHTSTGVSDWKQYGTGSGASDKCAEPSGDNYKLLANGTFTLYFNLNDQGGGTHKYWFTVSHI